MKLAIAVRLRVSGASGRSRHISAGYLSRPNLRRAKPLSSFLPSSLSSRCHRAHTRTWHGTALCSNIIGTLPREPMAASGRVYPKLQRNLLDERYIHEVTVSGDVSGFFAVSERANPERRDRYARALRS